MKTKHTYPLKMRVIAFILSLLTAFYLVPTSVFAASDKDTVKAESTTASTDVTSYPEGTLYEVERLREENVKHFHLEDGTYVAAQYDTAVHVQDSEGKWQDINNTLLSSAGGVYATEDARIKFSKKTTGNGTLFTLKDGEYKLSMSLIGASKGVNAIVTNSADNEQETKLNKLMNLEKLSSAIMYEDILSGINLEYVVRSLNVKENIIVKERKDSYSYSFELKLNKLEASVDESGNVLLINSAGDVKYTIPAPVVYDSVYSYADKGVASYSLEGKNGKYTLTVTVDPEWMNADERQFPVTVDPTVTAKPENFGLTKDIFCVFKGNPLELEITDFPSSLISSTTTSVKFGLQYRGAAGHYLPTLKLSYQGATVDAVAPKSFAYQWNITKLALARNPAAWSDGVSLLVSLVTTGDVINDNGTVWLTAPGTNIEVYNTPIFEVEYYSAVGLEDYYTYSTHDAGIAGSGAINLATGNLTFAIDTLTTTDGLMPFTPTLIYNTAYAGAPYSYSFDGIQTAYTSAYTPHGFMLNMQETIINDYYIDGDYVKNMMVFHDSDGTRHIFEMTDKGVYADTDGLGLIMDVGNNTVTITDKSKTVKTYTQASARPTDVNGAWYLSKIEDRVGNAVVFTVDSSYRPIKISLLPIGAESATDMLNFVYIDGKLAIVKNDVTDEAVLLKYSQTYNGNIATTNLNYLKQVIYAKSAKTEPDWQSFYYGGQSTSIITNATCEYYYTSDGKLWCSKDLLSGKRIEYTYSGDSVTDITEYGFSVEGQSVGFYYGNGYTDVTTSGNDEIYNNADDIMIRYIFDNLGRVISAYSTDAQRTEIFGASSGRYETQQNIKNNLKETAAVGGGTANYIVNGSFEIGNLQYWNASAGVRRFVTSPSTGAYCALFNVKNGEEQKISQKSYLTGGNYSLSLKYDNSLSAENTHIWLRIERAGEILIEKELAKDASKTNAYMSIAGTSFYSDNLGLVDIVIAITSVDGVSLTVDDIMLEKGLGIGEYNMIESGHFEPTYFDENGVSANTTDTFWSTASGSDISVGAGYSPFNSSLSLSNDLAIQNIASLYSKDNNSDFVYRISGFANASSLTGSGKFRLVVKVYYYKPGSYDRPCITYYYDFAPIVGEWQFLSGTFNGIPYAEDIEDTSIDYTRVDRIEVLCEYTGQDESGYALFDNIALTDISGNSVNKYAYDKNGNLIAKQSNYSVEYYEYDENDNLTRIANNNGEICDYTYNDAGLPVTEKYRTFKNGSTENYPFGNENIDSLIEITDVSTTEYTYNQYGLLENTIVSAGGKTMSSSATYILTAGNTLFGQPLGYTDASGISTSYLYSVSLGKAFATFNGNGGAVYSYDAFGRISEIIPVEKTGTSYFPAENTENVSYSYNSRGYLASITTDTTVYNFVHDLFGNPVRIKIDTTPVVSYEYNDNNGKINKINYSNGLSVTYVYNALEMLQKVCYNYSDGTSEDVYEYVYTRDGQLHSVKDLKNGKSTVYQYDSAGRLKSVYDYGESDKVIDFASAIGYDNDEGRINNVEYRWNYNSGSNVRNVIYSGYYSYNQDGSVSELNIEINDLETSISYEYDAFRRIGGITYTFDSGIVCSENFTYETDGNITSDRASSYTSTVGSNTNSYTYTYDESGNVASIVNASGSVYYLYDNINQLIREDNSALGFTYLYEYDNAGNLLKRYTYDYTRSGTLSSPVATDVYGYTDEAWGDKLSSYNGASFTYDGMGNPLTYYNGLDYTFTWEGRRLVSAVQQGTGIYNTYSFAYNDEGIRISKTINGVEHKYYLNGSQILGEEWGNNLLIYIYDASGMPIGMQYRNSTYGATSFDSYIFDKDLFGNIVGVYSDTGALLISYTYDAWGYHTVSYSNGGASTAAQYNPFRYRGYYFDQEMGMYYLQSRYYDPYTARFISPDSVEYLGANGDFSSYNLYAYCSNNPVMYTDPSGHFPVLAVVLGLVAVAGLITTSVGVATDNNLATAIGLTMVAIPALISGGMAVCGTTGVVTAIGAATMISGASTGLFASAEYQEAATGDNWMLDAGMGEGLYNGLMLGTASVATIGTIASGTIHSLKMQKILDIGKINGVRAQPGYPGIRFADRSGAIRSLELHSAHNGHGVHLQLNNWWLNHPKYSGQYYRAFSKHLEILHFLKGWF